MALGLGSSATEHYKKHAAPIQRLGWTSPLLLSICFAALSACALAPHPVPRTATPPLPQVDHHQHIWSRSAFAVTTDPGRPSVRLPKEFEHLLRDRESAAGDAARLQSLYTPQAVLLEGASGLWITGAADVARAAASGSRNLRLLPLSLEVDGDTAVLGGAGANVSPDVVIYRENFLLALRRGIDRRWRIAAETHVQQAPRVSAEEITAKDLISSMDRAGIRRAVILAAGYWFANRFVVAENSTEYERVREENDWAIAQARSYPSRLVVFCGVNPLRDYAVQEVERCARDRLVKGIKLHFANSGVDLRNPSHAERVKAVFAAANSRRLAVVAHLWVPGGYGAEQSRLFLAEVLPAAPDVVVQIAHLSGTGPGYYPPTDAALQVYVEAIKQGDPRMRNVYFDVASNVTTKASTETLSTIAGRLRQIGFGKILFGSDAAANDPASIRREWEAFLQLPLSDREFRRIAGNVAPYLR